MEDSPSNLQIVEINVQSPAQNSLRVEDQTTNSIELGLSFEEAVPLFLDYLIQRGAAGNTVKAFAHDLGILSDYFRKQTPVQNLLVEDLHSFLHWLEHDRGIKCSKKTLSRRIASTKGFFRWLQQESHLQKDPAAALKQVQPDPYFPAILDKKEVRSLYSAASGIFWNLEKQDVRPLLLLSLLLQTGMKKQECLNLRVADFKASTDQPFSVAVRRNVGGGKHKSRILPLNHSTIGYFEQYCQSNKLDADAEDRLFDCTARNLEYILEHLGQVAGINSCKVGFEVLRWTCAVNDFRLSMTEDVLRQKLGLSKVSWRDTRAKIETLL